MTDYPIQSSPLFNAIHDDHNNALRFKVLKFVEPDSPRAYKGRKWNFSYKRVKGFLTPNWLVIYHDKRHKVPLRDLEFTADTIVQGIVNIAKEIAAKYNLTIDETPLPFSSNRPEIKTPYLSANNFVEKEAKAVYPPPSPIELVGQNAVKNAWNLTESLILLNQNILLEIENKKKHQEVLNQMNETLKKMNEKMNENMKPKLSVWQKIQKLIKRERE